MSSSDNRPTAFLAACDLDHLIGGATCGLSTAEQAKAASIKCDSARMKYLQTRCFIRRQIGISLNEPSYNGEFVIDIGGKPRLPKPRDKLFFNISHTRSIIACVTLKGVDVGIDIEFYNRSISPSVIEHVFLPEEIRTFQQANEPRIAMLRGWTRKEAILKCFGSGLRLSLKSFCAPFDRTDKTEKLVNQIVCTEFGGDFYLNDIEVFGVFVGTVVARSPVSIVNMTPKKYTALGMEAGSSD